MNTRATFVPVLLLSALLASTLTLSGCQKDCACTTELRFNFCLTNRGAQALPDSLTYVRETAGSPVVDTADFFISSCFPERVGKHRVAVYSGDSLVYRSAWVVTDVEDCCHAKNATVDLEL